MSSLPRRGGRPWAIGLLAAVLLLGGCATGPDAHPRDPLEPYNRGMTRFNDGVDEAVLKPAATVYRAAVPDLVRTGVNNFFGNLRDLWSAVNAALQLRPQAAVENFMRFNLNTFLGLGGVLDIASEAQMERDTTDFGQTLGRWGVSPGPYLVLPLLGPSTLRDGSSLIVDRQFSASTLAKSDNAGYAVTSIEVINLRAGLLDATQLLDAVALDRYSFLRQAYLSRRLDQVYDGAPPMAPMENFDDPGDEPAKPAAAAKPTPPASAPAK
jgi:phospholipid-binding lipoprotein MlaA